MTLAITLGFAAACIILPCIAAWLSASPPRPSRIWEHDPEVQRFREWRLREWNRWRRR